MKGTMKEKASRSLIAAVMQSDLETASVFCINLITDILYFYGAISADTYENRINTPGTISEKNWSLIMPLSIEEMQSEKYISIYKKAVAASGR